MLSDVPGNLLARNQIEAQIGEVCGQQIPDSIRIVIAAVGLSLKRGFNKRQEITLEKIAKSRHGFGREYAPITPLQFPPHLALDLPSDFGGVSAGGLVDQAAAEAELHAIGVAALERELRQRLQNSGNLFGGAPLQALTGKLCVLPKTSLEVSADTLILDNSFCKLSFKVEHPGHNIMNVDPQTRMYVPLPNREPRYEVRTMGLRVETTFYALRAQHRASKQYRDWASRVVNDARDWFSPGNPLAPPQQFHGAP